VATIITYYDSNSFIIIPIISSSILNTFEAFLIFFLIKKYTEPHLILNNKKNITLFITIILIVSFITALLGALMHCYFLGDWYNYNNIFWSWSINDLLAFIIIAPLILSFPKKISINLKKFQKA